MFNYNQPDWGAITREFLNRKGWNQSDLAKRFGVKASTISQSISRGKFTNRNIGRLSNLMGRDLFVHLLAAETKETYDKAIYLGLDKLSWDEVKAGAVVVSGSAGNGEATSGGSGAGSKDRVQELEAQLAEERQAHALEVARLQAKIEVYQELQGKVGGEGE